MSQKQQQKAGQCPPVVIHELNAVKFQHRIVLIKDSVADAGSWSQYTELANHKSGLLANLDSASPLPVGIFRINSVVSQQVD